VVGPTGPPADIGRPAHERDRLVVLADPQIAFAYHFERHLTADRLLLLGQPDGAHAAFADLVEELVGS
jgi:hypothetical protein